MSNDNTISLTLYNATVQGVCEAIKRYPWPEDSTEEYRAAGDCSADFSTVTVRLWTAYITVLPDWREGWEGYSIQGWYSDKDVVTFVVERIGGAVRLDVERITAELDTELDDLLAGLAERYSAPAGEVQGEEGSPVLPDRPPTGEQEKRRYWSEIIRQANASGDVDRYLSDRELPRRTYQYWKKKLDM